MAAKKTLEIVPDTQPDIEAILSTKLADELISDVDLGKLAKLTLAKVATKLKTKLIDWLLTSEPSQFATTELQAIAMAEEDNAA